MGRKYKIHNQSQVYFVTFTVVSWIDIFTRNDYREIFIDSLKYCQQHKALELYAWSIMTNHVHLIIGSDQSNELQNIIRDLKSFTSRHIRKAIEQHAAESRKEWLLWMFGKAGEYNANNKDWQLWQQHSHPIELNTPAITKQKIDYLHQNPVAAGYVFEPQHWLWSSAYDYAGGKGILDIIFIN